MITIRTPLAALALTSNHAEGMEMTYVGGMAGWIHKSEPSRYVGGMAGWIHEGEPSRYVGGMAGWVSCQAAVSAAPEPHAASAAPEPRYALVG